MTDGKPPGPPPNRLWMLGVTGALAFLGIGILLLALHGRVHRATLDLVRAGELGARAQEIRIRHRELIEGLQDVEFGALGLLLSGSDGFGRRYQAGTRQVEAALARLRDLTDTDSVARAQLRDLEPAVAVRLADAARALDAARTEGPDAGWARLPNDLGLSPMRDLERRIVRGEADAERRARQAAEAASAQATLALRLLHLGEWGGLGIVAVLALLLNRMARERGRAAGRTAESEERFRTLVETTSQMVFSTDGDGNLVEDRSWRIFTGQDAEAGRAWGWLDAVHPDDRNSVAGAVREALDTGAHYRWEARLRRQDGQYRRVAVNGAALGGGRGGVREWIAAGVDVHDQREAEAGLVRTRAYLRTLLATAVDGIHVLDERGELVEASPSFYRMLGYSPEHPPKLRVSDWDMLWTREELMGRLAGGLETPEVFETRHRRADGSAFEVEVSMRGLEFEGRRLLYASSRDITRRKQAEAAQERAVRAGEALRQALLDIQEAPHLDVALSRLVSRVLELGGLDFGGVYLIRGSQAMLCHPRGLDPEFVAEVARRPVGSGYLKAALDHPGEVLKVTAHFPEHRDFGLRYGLVHVFCVALQAGGEPFGFVVAGTRRTEPPAASDIDQVRILAQETGSLFRKFRGEQRLRSVLATMAEGLIVVSADGSFAECNQNAERILGLPRDQILGRTSRDPCWRAVREDGSPFPVESFPSVSCLQTGQPYRDVVMGVHRPDGSLRWISINAEPMLEEGIAVPVAAVTSFADITTRRELEANMRQAQKMEAVGRLAGGIAHEFNNILGAMIMSLDLGRQLTTDAMLQEILAELQQQSRRAATLVRQMLAFSRRSIFRRQPVDVAELLEVQAEPLRLALGHRIQVELDLGPGKAWVHADRAALEQVLMNLGLNARDAMKEGGRLSLVLRAVDRSAGGKGRETPRDGRFVHLAVTDTGCGMDEPTLSRLFEPFFSTKGVGKATGLGLAMVQGIVEQHEGWVEVHSAPGKGSTFHLYLPALPPEGDGPRASPPG